MRFRSRLHTFLQSDRIAEGATVENEVRWSFRARPTIDLRFCRIRKAVNCKEPKHSALALSKLVGAIMRSRLARPNYVFLVRNFGATANSKRQEWTWLSGPAWILSGAEAGRVRASEAQSDLRLLNHTSRPNWGYIFQEGRPRWTGWIKQVSRSFLLWEVGTEHYRRICLCTVCCDCGSSKFRRLMCWPWTGPREWPRFQPRIHLR